jgi:hypothetical protein
LICRPPTLTFPGRAFLFDCRAAALIRDWREQWLAATDGATDEAFAFGWGQLNSCGGPAEVGCGYQTNWTAGALTPAVNTTLGQDPLGEWSGLGEFCAVRLAQDKSLALPQTFQAIILDTPAASGSVHSPYKQAAGARLARGALATAYGYPQA